MHPLKKCGGALAPLAPPAPTPLFCVWKSAIGVPTYTGIEDAYIVEGNVNSLALCNTVYSQFYFPLMVKTLGQ